MAGETSETERDHTLNYLDISIHRTPTGIRMAIYRKPTFTDTIIPTHPTTQHTTNMQQSDFYSIDYTPITCNKMNTITN